MENEDPNNTNMQSKNYPEAFIQDEHTHPLRIKNKRTYLKMLKKEQKADIKDDDKLQRGTSGNPWEKPSENKNTVKKTHKGLIT